MKRAMTILAVLLPLACSRPAPLGPPDVQYGQTDCAQCGMTVSDERFAAGLVLEMPDGQREGKAFDDIGCMSAFVQARHEGTVLARYVKDFNTRQWLAADKASYVRGDAILSPMGYGLLAVQDGNDARAIAAAKSATVVLNPAAAASPSAAAR